MRGADQIGEFVFGEDPHRKRKVYHAVERGHLPGFKLGGVLCARRSAILARIAQHEQSASCNEEAA
jgi:hypothetical protein